MLVRLEQLSPFPHDLLANVVAQYASADLVWAQEEPKNMGAWCVTPCIPLYTTAAHPAHPSGGAWHGCDMNVSPCTSFAGHMWRHGWRRRCSMQVMLVMLATLAAPLLRLPRQRLLTYTLQSWLNSSQPRFTVTVNDLRRLCSRGGSPALPASGFQEISGRLAMSGCQAQLPLEPIFLAQKSRMNVLIDRVFLIL